MAIQITKVSDDFSVTPQLTVEDVAVIAELGFKTIINNRPDLEGGTEQPSSHSIQQAAESHGLTYIHIPVIPNNIHTEQIDAYSDAFHHAAKPVLGFCKSGKRAETIYQLAQAKQQKPMMKAFANIISNNRFNRWRKA